MSAEESIPFSRVLERADALMRWCCLRVPQIRPVRIGDDDDCRASMANTYEKLRPLASAMRLSWENDPRKCRGALYRIASVLRVHPSIADALMRCVDAAHGWALFLEFFASLGLWYMQLRCGGTLPQRMDGAIPGEDWLKGQDTLAFAHEAMDITTAFLRNTVEKIMTHK